MKKEINVGNKAIEFETSAALPRIYRATFGADMLVDMQKLSLDGGDVEFDADMSMVMENVAFAMAKHANSKMTDDIVKWLSQFETFDLYNALPEILELWANETKQISAAKKNTD